MRSSHWHATTHHLTLRHSIHSTVAGAVATLASAPLNYARNMQYAVPPEGRVPRTMQVMRDLAQEIREQPTGYARWSILQVRGHFYFYGVMANIEIGAG